jgi:hypothetical protein
VQNVYTRSTSTVSYETLSAMGGVQGTLALQELLGGFRYQLGDLEGMAHVFVGGGWGWTWYHVDHVTCSGHLDCVGKELDYRQNGGYAVTPLPSRRWWPNTWYGSVGLEITAPRTAWMFDRVGYGLELEYTGLLHRLGATRPYESALGPVGRRELSIGLVTSW